MKQKIDEDQDKVLEEHSQKLEKLKEVLLKGKNRLGEFALLESELREKSREITRGIAEKKSGVSQLAEKISSIIEKSVPLVLLILKLHFFRK
jgi:phosphomevalonate kinase